jgi:hypothetical protein
MGADPFLERLAERNRGGASANGHRLSSWCESRLRKTCRVSARRCTIEPPEGGSRQDQVTAAKKTDRHQVLAASDTAETVRGSSQLREATATLHTGGLAAVVLTWAARGSR